MKRKLLLAFGALYLLGFCAWSISLSLRGDQSALPTLGAFLVLGAFALAVSSCLHLKKLFVAAYRPNPSRGARPDEFSRLERDGLEQLTREWEALGFEQRGDHASGEDRRVGAVFSRRFEHPGEGAVVEIAQHLAPLRTMPWTSSATSFWGQHEPVLAAARTLESTGVPPLSAPVTSDEPSDVESRLWVFVTHNRAPNRFWVLLRQSRLLSLRLEPGASPEAIWRAHRERRALIEARLGEPHLRGDLMALLEAHAVVLRASSLRRLSRTPAWKFGRALVSRALVPAHYDGDLPA